MRRLCVLMATEGTYPFHKGGVSTWCHVLTQQLPDVDFKLFAVVANPYQMQCYDLSENVRDVIKVPLWGTADPVEFSWRSPFSQALKSKFETTPLIIKTHFVPLFESFLRAILFENVEMSVLGKLLVEFHEYFQRYDYHKSMSAVATWAAFQRITLDNWQYQYDPKSIILTDLTEIMGLLYRLLLPIQVPIPDDVDMTHSSAAAFCGLACVIAKIQKGIPYLLTEHGINIREQYLNLIQNIKADFTRQFLYRLMRSVVKLNFHFADIVSPVCEFNARWERWWGVPQEKIKVIYNGADPEKFHPTPPTKKERPVVMNMGLIFPLKGQLDLIKAAAIVRDTVPDVEFRFYGRPSDDKYFAECEKCVKHHNLENTINFAGFISEPWRAYSEADVVAMSSISEGFPFAIIEAMLSGATIVSTDVGGVSEAIGDTGLMVRAGCPEQMAEAILKLLLLSDDERSKFGQRALDRSLSLFTQQTCLDEHRKLYHALCNPSSVPTPSLPEPILMPSLKSHSIPQLTYA